MNHQPLLHAVFQGIKLRQLIDERYTASSLLNLSQSVNDDTHHQAGDVAVTLMPSTSICKNFYADVLAENGFLRDGFMGSSPSMNSIPLSAGPTKRVRRSGKYSPQERDRIRYDNNNDNDLNPALSRLIFSSSSSL